MSNIFPNLTFDQNQKLSFYTDLPTVKLIELYFI